MPDSPNTEVRPAPTVETRPRDEGPRAVERNAAPGRRPSRSLRVLAVGPLAPGVRARCHDVDPEALFIDSPAAVPEHLTSRVSPEDAVVIVSTTMGAADCGGIILAESRRAEPSSLGFVVNPEASFVEDWLRRLCGPTPSPATGVSAAFVDEAFIGMGISAVEDVRAGRASPQRAAARAQEPLGCALFYGHSNGQCHGAGGVAICQRDRHAPRPAEDRQLPCFGGAPCRFEKGDTYVRISADTLRAELVIDFTCFGYVLGDHALLAGDGVGLAILQNPHLRALVTSLRAFAPNRHDYALATYLAHDGLELGRLAGVLNRARVREVDGTVEFICLGDPRATLRPSVLDVGELEGSHVTLSRPDDSGRGSCDLGGWAKPASGEIMLYHGASSAAWAPDGRVYVTLPTGRPSASLRRAPTESARAALSFEPLIPQLDFLEHYLAEIGEDPLASSNPTVAQAIADAESTRRRLRRKALTFDPSVIRDGSVCDGKALAELREHRAKELDTLSKQLLALHRHTLTARSLLFVAGVDTLRAAGPWTSGPACSYCGAATSSMQKHLPGSAFARTVAFCDRCGRLFEGAGFARVIEVETKGARSKVRIEVVNGFPFEVPVRGVVALQTFDGRGDEVVGLESTVLAPKQTRELATELRIPDEVPPGMHRIKAAITVGPQVELLVRNWLVRAHQP